jgi:hypothetical protein
MGVWTVVMKGILLLVLVLILIVIVIVSYKALSHLWGVYLANPPTPAPLHPCTPAPPPRTTLACPSPRVAWGARRGWGGVGGHGCVDCCYERNTITSTSTNTNTNTNSNSTSTSSSTS